jgi:hypothetical protein
MTRPFGKWPKAKWALVVAATGCVLFASGLGGAQAVTVPVSVQAELIVKVAAYDKNLPQRATDRVRIAIVEKAGDGNSIRAAGQLRSSLREIANIAGFPHEETVVDFSDAPSLASECRAGRVSIVYIGPGLGDQIDAIRKAFDGENILTIGALSEYVPRGIVLGFDLRAGRASLLINLTQARKQKVAMRPEAVRLMTVYE